MPITPFATERDVLGYTLKEQIGSGGFGEVWSAEAPGGLMKAVKVVFGYHDQKHAQAEIKALDRVKQLRHPFLLSLERIEIYENQLVVVTELADGSLADVFNEYITAGQTGIPRDKLLKFLKSSAEALDYLSEEHGLQHLDIKPENLLMIGGHVKVADFGLIKDLQSHDQSLMTGMTPTYAAPELFDGRPHKNSDQYSLAIVYEEMLTGVRPFSGTTAAQLAAQHMHGKPNLRPLDSHDQAVVTKALAKDPELRFGNCVEMIEELANKKRLVKKAIRRTSNHRQEEADTMMLSGILEATPTNVGTAIISDTRLPFQASEIENSDPPECDPQNSTFRPTLVVGIGATANRVVQKYKHQLINRNGDFEAMPSVRILCIDTDREDLIRLQRVDQPWMLMPGEALEIPLRKPQDYRDRINSNEFGWL
ncbi:MAG: protein kinase, partial [Planctomycetota bacterium]